MIKKGLTVSHGRRSFEAFDDRDQALEDDASWTNDHASAKSRALSSATPHPTTHLNERTNEAHTQIFLITLFSSVLLSIFFNSVIYLCCFTKCCCLSTYGSSNSSLSFFFSLFPWVISLFGFTTHTTHTYLHDLSLATLQLCRNLSMYRLQLQPTSIIFTTFLDVSFGGCYYVYNII